MFSVANGLTLFRLCVAIIGPMIFLYNKWIFWFLLCLASLTDILDGYMARKHQKTSLFGKFFDSFTDKMILISSSLCLITLYKTSFVLIATHIMILRELLIFTLRIYAHIDHVTLPVYGIAKLKTVTQMGALCLLFFPLLPVLNILTYILLIPTALSLISAGLYIFTLLERKSVI